MLSGQTPLLVHCSGSRTESPGKWPSEGARLEASGTKSNPQRKTQVPAARGQNFSWATSIINGCVIVKDTHPAGEHMITIAIRAREIVSSNVDSLVSKAGEPRKMLRLLQSEIEEALIALHGDAAKAKRQQGRMHDTAARLAAAAEEWTGKAKIAVDHGREDLARAALLTREAERAKAADAAAAAEALGAQIADAASVIADLEAKRAAITARIADMAHSETVAAPAAADTHIDKRIDRIEALERRAGFADAPAAETPSPAALEDEIASLQQASAIEAELAALKATAAPAKKAAGKKRG